MFNAHDRQASARARLIVVLAAAVVLLLLGGGVLTSRQARADAPAPAGGLGPDTGGAYAMHSMLQLNSPYAFKAEMFSSAAAAGAAEIRVDASLGALNNHWIASAMWQDLSDYERLSVEYGVRVLLDLNASNDPSLETCQPGVDPAPGTCGVTDLTGYASEVAALVRQSAGVIDDFEIVNEPDGRWAFSGTPQQYAGMLATAYSAVHANDPNGRVVLGGIMSPNDAGWLQQVFATPNFNAAHAFDVASVHLRDTVTNMTVQLAAWKTFFATAGDGNLPLWVTETGYPSDPAFQYDPAYRGTDATSGLAEQADYLAQALPALVSGGAARVFVAERDNLGGQYASEGLIGGAVTDNEESNPNPVPKPALSVFSELAAGAATTTAPVLDTTTSLPPAAAADVPSTPVAAPAAPPATETTAALAKPVGPAAPPARAKKAAKNTHKLRRRLARRTRRRPAKLLRHGGATQRQGTTRAAA